jgi:pyrimidine-nucleoside phosphorylase
MRAVDLIRKKRDGGSLDRSEIDFFIAGVTGGTLPDYQIAALLMAIVLRGMTPEETAWLTTAMVESGTRLDLADVTGPKADKHSTGGVGDKTSLIVAPLVAACGVAVPMMSGRALGHTGGTLDKLESIPGFQTILTIDRFVKIVSTVGCAIIGQTAELAPADRKLYALRDVTATVESVPLVCSSIMSKKIAEGVNVLVLDVKCGRGAFMKTEAEARALAEALVRVGTAAGVRTEALITAMDAPLGRAVGNALEVREAVETLQGRGPSDVQELSMRLAARMISLAGAAPDDAAATGKARAALASGAGLARFADMVEAQGGDPRIVDDPDRLPSAPRRCAVPAPRDGVLVSIDPELVGRAAMLLGGGRARADDTIDPAVGALVLQKPGARVRAGQPLVELHYRDDSSLASAHPLAVAAITIGPEAPAPSTLVLHEVR